MEVGTVYGGYYGAKGYEGVRKEEKRVDAGFAGKVAEKGAVSPKDMTLDEYKAYFDEKMNSLYTHPSQRGMNWTIDITDAAYKKMQEDPEYEKKILDALAKNKAVDFGGNIPVVAYTHIDDTYEKCYGYTQGMKENVGYSGSSSTKQADAGREKRQGRRSCWKNIWKSGRRLRDSSRSCWMKRLQRRSEREAGWQRYGAVSSRWRGFPVPMNRI